MCGIYGTYAFVHSIHTLDQHFMQFLTCLWPFQLSAPRGGFPCQRHGFGEQRGGDPSYCVALPNELAGRTY